ncbi:GNAT family N-acetyltransferase [Rummeliibacillus pycnus]|uniref:GNAT family N-acetyltransferase n=1 Tax=Rummeliibacillus pycnus TaxID=101070 RepID=UPI0037C997EA
MEKRLYLRAFEYNDLEFLNELRNDDILFELTCGNKYYVSSERDKKWIEDKIFNNYNQLYLMISSIDSGRPIGYTCAKNIDYINRKCEYGGIIISKDLAGNGYAFEAGQLFLDHLFGELGLNMIYTFCREDHKATIRLLEKSGFKIEGKIRDLVYKRGGFHNAYICTLLSSDYFVNEYQNK